MKRRSILRLLGLAPVAAAVAPAEASKVEPPAERPRASPPAFSGPTADECMFNRMTVDFASQEVVLYDADGVTELKRWHLEKLR